MKINDAINMISDYYNINNFELVSFLESNSNINSNIILPFCGKINPECCKAVVFNHGLYTQCNNITDDRICKSCTKLKYGDIYNRSNSKLGEFKTPDGKKELDYNKFVQKMGYDISEVVERLTKKNLDHPIMHSSNNNNPIKRGRGRPKKGEILEEKGTELDDTIEVVEVYINSVLYYKTKENILLDSVTHTILGKYNQGKLEKIS